VHANISNNNKKKYKQRDAVRASANKQVNEKEE
jgi:hypothetical protein